MFASIRGYVILFTLQNVLETLSVFLILLIIHFEFIPLFSKKMLAVIIRERRFSMMPTRDGPVAIRKVLILRNF